LYYSAKKITKKNSTESGDVTCLQTGGQGEGNKL